MGLWGWLNTCLPMGSSDSIPCFTLLVYMGFAFLFFTSTQVFYLLSFRFSPHFLWWGSKEWLHGACLLAGVKSQQNFPMKEKQGPVAKTCFQTVLLYLQSHGLKMSQNSLQKSAPQALQ